MRLFQGSPNLKRRPQYLHILICTSLKGSISTLSTFNSHAVPITKVTTQMAKPSALPCTLHTLNPTPMTIPLGNEPCCRDYRTPNPQTNYKISNVDSHETSLQNKSPATNLPGLMSPRTRPGPSPSRGVLRVSNWGALIAPLKGMLG